MAGPNQPPKEGSREQLERDNQTYVYADKPFSQEGGAVGESDPLIPTLDDAIEEALLDADPQAYKQGLREDATISSSRVFATGSLIAALGRDNVSPETHSEPTNQATDYTPYGHDEDLVNRIGNEHMAGTAEGKIAGTIGVQKQDDYIAEQKKREDEAFAAFVASQAVTLSAAKVAAYQNAFGGGGLFGEDWKTPTMTRDQFNAEVDQVVGPENQQFQAAATAADTSLQRAQSTFQRSGSQQYAERRALYEGRLAELRAMNTPEANRTAIFMQQHLGLSEVGVDGEINLRRATRFHQTTRALEDSERWIESNRALVTAAQAAVNETVQNLEAVKNQVNNITTVGQAQQMFDQMQGQQRSAVEGLTNQGAHSMLVLGLENRAEMAEAAGKPEEAQMMRSAVSVLKGETSVADYQAQIDQLKQAPDANDPNSETGKAIAYMEGVAEIARAGDNSPAAKEFMLRQLDQQNVEMQQMAQNGDLAGMQAALQAKAEETLSFTKRMQSNLTQSMEMIDQTADLHEQLATKVDATERYVMEITADGNVTEAEYQHYLELRRGEDVVADQLKEKSQQLAATYQGARAALENEALTSGLSESTRKHINDLMGNLDNAQAANLSSQYAWSLRRNAAEGSELKNMSREEFDGFRQKLAGAATAIVALDKAGGTLDDTKVQEIADKYGLDTSHVQALGEANNTYVQQFNFSSDFEWLLFGPNNDYSQTMCTVPGIAPLNPALTDPALNNGVSGANYSSFADNEFNETNPTVAETGGVTPSYSKPWSTIAWNATTDFMASLFGGSDKTTAPTVDPLGQQPGVMLASNDPSKTVPVAGQSGGGGGSAMA